MNVITPITTEELLGSDTFIAEVQKKKLNFSLLDHKKSNVKFWIWTSGIALLRKIIGKDPQEKS